MKRLVGPVAFAALGFVLGGCGHRPAEPEAFAPTPVTQPVTWAQVQALPRPPGPDFTFSYGAAPEQVVDVYLPAKPELRRPLAILLHGGCWLNRFDRHYFSHLAEALRQRGWVVANVEYRRLGDAGGGWPGSMDDVQAAATAVLAGVKKWRVDPQRVVAVGHSAGGHLALLLAGREERVRGVVGLAAITDLAAYRRETSSCAEGARALVTEAQVAEADPQQQPVPAGAKISLWSGADDPIVPASYGDRYASRDPRIRHRVWPGAGHFDLVSPESVVWPELLREFERWSAK